ncbi:MAG TPA: PilZ domain-containing protein [Pyrinomonadaceae bacterium]
MNARHPSSQPKPYVDDFEEGRRHAPRRAVKLEARIRFGAPGPGTETDAGAQLRPEVVAEACNLSETGLAIKVAQNHIGVRFLNVVGRKLRITLELPGGPVRLQARAMWCKWLSQAARRDYIIGLRITEMSDQEWVRIVRHVREPL